MFAIACVGWIFFRAPSIDHAWYVMSHCLSSSGAPDVHYSEVVSSWILWSMIIGLWLAEWVYRNRPALFTAIASGETSRLVTRHALLVAILFSYLVTQQGKVQPFIYFQF
jgi:hypothetical protein